MPALPRARTFDDPRSGSVGRRALIAGLLGLGLAVAALTGCSSQTASLSFIQLIRLIGAGESGLRPDRRRGERTSGVTSPSRSAAIT